EPRRRPLEIKLRQEGVAHLFGPKRAIGAGEIGAVAPVLISAEEERLDAILPRLLADGEHVCLRNRARIDALLPLDRRQRGNAVAQARGSLELEGGRGLAHLVGEPLTDRAAAA